VATLLSRALFWFPSFSNWSNKHAGKLKQPFGFAHLWASGDTVSHSVAVILAIMSIASWYLILAKAWDWWTVRRASRAVGKFWAATA
jgi:hypothetical protein